MESNNSKQNIKKGRWNRDQDRDIKFQKYNEANTKKLYELIKQEQTAKEIEEKISNWVANTDDNPFKGTSIAKLVQMYKAGNKGLLDTIARFEAEFDPRGVRTQYIKRYAGEIGDQQMATGKDAWNGRQAYDDHLFQGLQQYIYNNKKWSDGSPVEPDDTTFDAIREQADITQQQLPNSVLRVIVALDDWGEVKDKLMRLIKQHGPKVARFVGDKLLSMHPLTRSLKPVVQAAEQILSAANPVGVFESIDEPSTKVMTSKLQSDMMYDKPGANYRNPQDEGDDIDKLAICSFFNPELYVARLKSKNQLYKTQVRPVKNRYTFSSGSTTAQQNIYAFISPLSLFGLGSTVSDSFISWGNEVDPNSGSILNPNFTAGPLVGLTTATVAYAIRGFSVRLSFPNSSDTNSGFLQFTWANDVTSGGSFLQDVLQGGDVVISGSAKEEYRMIRPRIGALTNDFTLPSSFGSIEGFQIALTNLPPSTSALTVEISAVVESRPVAGTFQLKELSYPSQEPYTLEAIDQLLAHRPELFTLSVQEAKEFCDQLKKSSPTYKTFMKEMGASVYYRA